MKPWCAEGFLPTAANLNLYRGRFSRVAWHSGNEPLFGERGESKLIVSMSFGTRARFKWKGESCLDSEADSCWLDHGDLFVMDGSTLAARVRLVISRLTLVFVLPLDFHGRVRVVRSMYLPAALHGIEASLLASDSLRRLRSAVRRVVWSRHQPLASVGAFLSLLDGPTGCDPAFCVVWFRFRLLRRYLALWPAEVGRVYRLLGMVHEGCPGHGPVHLLYASAAEVGFEWDPRALAWVLPGLPLLDNLAGPVEHFQAAILDAWRNKVAADLCCRQGFRGGSLLDVRGSLQLLDSSHVREGDKALLRSIMVGGVWNGLLLGRVRSQAVP